jgi:hypothetical protein
MTAFRQRNWQIEGPQWSEPADNVRTTKDCNVSETNFPLRQEIRLAVAVKEGGDLVDSGGTAAVTEQPAAK